MGFENVWISFSASELITLTSAVFSKQTAQRQPRASLWFLAVHFLALGDICESEKKEPITACLLFVRVLGLDFCS